MRGQDHVGQARPVLRCVIVDDNSTFVAAATALLVGEGLVVAATASCSQEAVEVVSRERPDVVLLDVSLGRESGFEVARQLAQLPWRAPVVLISTYEESDLLELMEEAPVAGFVSKARLSAAAVHRLVNAHRGT